MLQPIWLAIWWTILSGVVAVFALTGAGTRYEVLDPGVNPLEEPNLWFDDPKNKFDRMMFVAKYWLIGVCVAFALVIFTSLFDVRPVQAFFATETPTPTATFTATVTPTPSNTPTITPTLAPSEFPTVTPSPTLYPTYTPRVLNHWTVITQVVTKVVEVTRMVTSTPMPTYTAYPTYTPWVITASPTPSETPTPMLTETPTP